MELKKKDGILYESDGGEFRVHSHQFVTRSSKYSGKSYDVCKCGMHKSRHGIVFDLDQKIGKPFTRVQHRSKLG